MQKTLKIDGHHHFWKYTAKDYGWMSDQMSVIRRDFLPADLKAEITKAGVDGVVSVQARQILEETRWLLELASQNSFIKGVVGWVPLTDPKVGASIEKFAGNKKLRGMRHVLHDEADDMYIARSDFGRGVDALHYYGLVYDILIFEKHLPQTIQFVDKHPGMVFVLDHIAKPKIKEHLMSPWRENIKELAKRPNVYCKISGMVTEADWKHWTESDLKPYIDTVIEAFTPRRLMFGSDWPVCLVATQYSRWHAHVAKAIAKLSASEQARILGGTAIEAYGLEA